MTFFSDATLWAAILRTLFIMAVAVPLEFVLGLGLATLFVDTFPGRRIFYSILLTPMMVVPAVAGYMFYMLFQSNGPINQILSFLTNSNVQLVWLSVPPLALVAVIVADVWAMDAAGISYTARRHLGCARGSAKGRNDARGELAAALSSYRFATDANRYYHCNNPTPRKSFKLFDVMFVMTRGGPGTATETISLYIYKQTFNDLEWSYVAAIGLTLLVILSVLAVFGMRFMKHEIEIEKAMVIGKRLGGTRHEWPGGSS